MQTSAVGGVTSQEKHAMAGQWFVGSGGARSGPFTEEQMRQLAASGRLAPTDLVWREGMAGWQRASSLAQLFTAAPAAPPAPASNPYAAPGAVTGALPRAAAPAVNGGSYSFGEAFALAGRTFSAQWVSLVVIGLVSLGMTILMGLPQWVLQALGQASGDELVAATAALGGSCLGLILNIVVGFPLFAGLLVAAANVTAGRAPGYDCFLGFNRFGPVVLSGLLVAAIMAGVAIVCYIPLIVLAVIGGAMAAMNPGNEVVAGLFVALGGLVTILALVVGMACVGTRVFFTPALVADPALGHLGVMEALKCNWAVVTIPRGFSLAGLGIVGGLIAAFSVFLLCVGYILAGLPFFLALGGAAYTLLFRTGTAADPAGGGPAA